MSVKQRLLKELNAYLAPKRKGRTRFTKRPAQPADTEHFRKVTEKHHQERGNAVN